ncbi:NfuA family Fe-S biogenesis protein [Buchnera aphidicola (Muscaphis stroyani)]|uniref:Fe/S biogenesis protein NfuA n=1 Tax=Buchnera aphidicola (Muscaphis stroyani) TaxID=1241869 RepID=A0A4D6YJ90_9GAMM|nr:NfuA family Fe-S biogenesis protein [Buchnera aphidicola]QCI24575.1 NfuA family Fe-S biogenesis protein [Buchnera aphidicola (Muscaphis stroyani)]
MIKISDLAHKHLVFLLSKEPIGTQIRVFIKNPGTHTAECGLAYCSKEEIKDLDVEFKYDKFNVYVHNSFVDHLKDSEIDILVDNISSQLTFKAPYAKKNFSIKENSLEKKIKNFLNIEINPQLSMHGGQVNLVKITSSNTAIIAFSGGCNGCSMIGLTLKETIEKKLLFYFPEIKKVSDETNHLRGNHSFY